MMNHNNSDSAVAVLLLSIPESPRFIHGLSSVSSVQGLSNKPKKLLVVEDNKSSQKFLHILLERRGHYCEVASNGLIALNMMKATLSNFNTEDLHLRGYDVVLMNLVMPVMNGLDSTKGIRQLGYKGPIIGLTTLCFYEDLDLFIKAGLSAILVKPLNMDKVYSIINSEHTLTNTSNGN